MFGGIRRAKGSTMNIKTQVERNETLAERELNRMRGECDPSVFHRRLKRYIRLRYLLDDDPYWDDDLSTITQYSIRRTLEKTGDPAGLSDLGVNCAGSSSATTKRLLLVISLRKGLDITLDPDEVARIETVSGLAALLQTALLNK